MNDKNIKNNTSGFTGLDSDTTKLLRVNASDKIPDFADLFKNEQKKEDKNNTNNFADLDSDIAELLRVNTSNKIPDFVDLFENEQKKEGKVKNNNFADLDSDIAELLGVNASDEIPDFADLFENKHTEEYESETTESENTAFLKEQFTTITKFEEAPKPFFADKEFYKIILKGEGAIAQKIHAILSDFLETKSQKNRTIYREKLIVAYWELASSIAGKIDPSLPMPKRLLLRYGILLPTLLTKEQQLVLSTIIMENDTNESVYYADEWLDKIATGEISPSAVDETKKIKNKQEQNPNVALEKEQGHRDSILGFMKNKAAAIHDIENIFSSKITKIKEHSIMQQYENLPDSYSSEQKIILTEFQELAKKALKYDKEYSLAIENLEEVIKKVETLNQKAHANEEISLIETQTIIEEFITLKQMVKMSAGRTGNYFPILVKQYMRSNIKDIATRENIISIMSEVEQIDPDLFKRTFKNQTNRIVPNILILPGYGEYGVCWEPFEKFQRATGKGRLAIPLYPKDVKTAVIYALGDLRWQIAKETVSYYWMEEGITGWYYQWFTSKKMRGDVKEYFLSDYYLWIAKESHGMQKLDNEVRGIFWRNIPFPQNIKDHLKNRGFVYSELYKKDINISLSDGY